MESYPATGDAVRAARRLARRAVDLDDDLVDQIELVTAELAANAVRHAATPFSVSVAQADHLVRIEVSDRSAVLPQLQAPDHAARSGRGLRIVDRITERWGAHRTARGKVVWAELDTKAPSSA